MRSNNFDWDNITSVILGPSNIPIPNDILNPKYVEKMYLGQVPPRYPVVIYIDGMAFTSEEVNFKMKSSDNFPKSMCLIIELNSGAH